MLLGQALDELSDRVSPALCLQLLGVDVGAGRERGGVGPHRALHVERHGLRDGSEPWHRGQQALDPLPNAARVAGSVVLGATAVAAGAAAASAPHSALRKSFHFMPFTVPADCAALYLALHSCAVRAFAGAEQAKAISAASPDSAP